MKNFIAFITASLAFMSGLFLAAFIIAGIFQLLLAGKLDHLGLKIFITTLVIFVTSFWLTKTLNFASSPEETKKPTNDKYQRLFKMEFRKSSWKDAAVLTLIVGIAIIVFVVEQSYLGVLGSIVCYFWFLHIQRKEDRLIGIFNGQEIGINEQGITDIHQDIHIPWQDMDAENLTPKKALCIYSKANKQNAIVISYHLPGFDNIQDMVLQKAVMKNKQQEIITPDHSLLQPEIFRLKFSSILGYIVISLVTTIFYSFILSNLDNPDNWIALLAIWFWPLIIFSTITRPTSITVAVTGIVIKRLLCRSIKLQWQDIIEVELKMFNAEGDIHQTLWLKAKQEEKEINFELTSVGDELRVYKKLEYIRNNYRQQNNLD